MEEIVLKINKLSKHYGKLKALNDLSIDVKKGQVFGLLGPNGSGKTTTLGILLGVLKPSAGSFSWFDNANADENRKRIGALLETPNFYPYLNAIDNLKVVAKIKHLTSDIDQKIDEILKKVNLYEKRKLKFRAFSLGMKQRLAIASTMLNDPEVYVLDEPTNGLDPEGIAEIRNLIIEIAQQGKTIIIASHILDEIEKVCTHVAILKKGKLLYQSDIQSLMKQEKQLLINAENITALKSEIDNIPETTFINELENGILITLSNELSPANLNKILGEKGIYLAEISEKRKNLESIFLEIVK